MPQDLQLARPQTITYVTPRDIAMVLFFRRRLAVWTFTIVLGAFVLFALLRRPVYHSQMKFLVNLERTDPVVTTDPGMAPKSVPGITDEQVRLELHLLKTQDLLRDVVIACNLHAVQNQSALASLSRWLGLRQLSKPQSEAVRTATAVRKLQRDLAVDVLPNSPLIRAEYSSPDPKLSQQVLQVLSDLYLKKHLAVHRPPGTYDFFKQEADRYHKQLEEAESAREQFTRASRVASIDAEKETTLRKLTETEVDLQETRGSIEVMNQRVRTLQARMTEIPSRLTTQVRVVSGRPSDQLESTILNLELKRTELVSVFQPDYPAVKQVERQIADARAELAASQQRRVLEETTDRDPAYEWLRAELEKEQANLVGLQSREKAMTAIIGHLGWRAKQLNELDIRQRELVRSVNFAESAYLAYRKKQEDARISDALDSRRILNVKIADQPSLPVFPSAIPSSIVLLVGLCCAILGSGGVAFAAERVRPSFRTPDHVRRYLDIPVIAALPERPD